MFISGLQNQIMREEPFEPMEASTLSMMLLRGAKEQLFGATTEIYQHMFWGFFSEFCFSALQHIDAPLPQKAL